MSVRCLSKVGKHTSLKILNNSQLTGKPSTTKQKAPSDTYALRDAVNGSFHPKKVPDRHEEDEMAFIVNANALIYPFS